VNNFILIPSANHCSKR